MQATSLRFKLVPSEREINNNEHFYLYRSPSIVTEVKQKRFTWPRYVAKMEERKNTARIKKTNKSWKIIQK